MSDALDMFWCDKCATYYVPKTTVTGRIIPHCLDGRIQGMSNQQTVVGPRFFLAPPFTTRGSLIDQEV